MIQKIGENLLMGKGTQRVLALTALLVGGSLLYPPWYYTMKVKFGSDIGVTLSEPPIRVWSLDTYALVFIGSGVEDQVTDAGIISDRHLDRERLFLQIFGIMFLGASVALVLHRRPQNTTMSELLKKGFDLPMTETTGRRVAARRSEESETQRKEGGDLLFPMSQNQ